ADVEMPWCALSASPSVAAEPRCRYGAVAQTSRSVGTSLPVNGPPRRSPLSSVIVPMFSGLLLALFVKAEPLWQLPQFFDWNTCLPATAAAVSVPSAFRSGLGEKAFSEAT